MQKHRSDHERVSVLECGIDRVDMQEALHRIEALIKQNKAAMVITLNAEIIYQALKNQQLQSIINRADLITPDGIGVIWAGKILGISFPERVTGIDLLHNLCSQATIKQWRLYFLGAAPQIAQQAANRLEEEFPGLIVCGVRDGYFSEEEEAGLIEEINEARPDIIAVALGAPKQEIWMDKHQHNLKAAVMMGVGGSLDVLSGNKKRAPNWAIRMNLEWLYRLACEPKRIKRQIALPLFMIKVLRSRFAAK